MNKKQWNVLGFGLLLLSLILVFHSALDNKFVTTMINYESINGVAYMSAKKLSSDIQMIFGLVIHLIGWICIVCGGFEK